VFVEVLSVFAKEYLLHETKLTAHKIFYDGGGGFFLYASDSRSMEAIKKLLKTIEVTINASIVKEDIYIALSIVSIGNEEDFASYWQEIALASNKDKLRKYLNDFIAFDPYAYDDSVGLVELLDMNVGSLKAIASRCFDHLCEVVDAPSLKSNAAIQAFQPLENFPKWHGRLYAAYQDEIDTEVAEREAKTTEKAIQIARGNVIDYQFLAHFAYERTGTRKIAILKMDIDDLSNLFRHAPSQSVGQKVSQLISTFLSDGIADLLRLPFPNRKYTEATLQDNIYTIFSGGDDCFFVGAWDAILEFVAHVRTAFNQKAREIEEVFEGLAIAEDQLTLPPTISVGVVLVEPTYPVVRFDKLASQALEEAKYSEQYNFSKNKITLFDEVLSWHEFSELKANAQKLKELVKKKGEPKSTLNRIQQSAGKYQLLRDKENPNIYINLAVGKLFYMIRHARNEATISKDIITPYVKDLIGAFTRDEYINPMKYPMAARWAELLTRNYEKQHEINGE
jgi:CRISPR-associated protein Csm1